MKTKIIISVVVILTAFAAGRYSVQKPAVTTIEDKHTDTEVHKDKDVHKITTITKDPDGKTVTTIVEDSTTHTDKDRTTDSHLDQQVTPAKTNTLHLAAMAGTQLGHGLVPAYGLSVSKQVLGPITVGAFGFNNGLVGVTVGLDF
jgi:hypothetical protein